MTEDIKMSTAPDIYCWFVVQNNLYVLDKMHIILLKKCMMKEFGALLAVLRFPDQQMFMDLSSVVQDPNTKQGWTI